MAESKTVILANKGIAKVILKEAKNKNNKRRIRHLDFINQGGQIAMVWLAVRL